MPEREFSKENIGQVLKGLPPWLVRWGNTSLFILLGLVFCLAFFVRFREKKEIPLNAVAALKNQVVLAEKDIGLYQFIPDGSKVRTGDTILLLLNDSNSFTPVLSRYDGWVRHCYSLSKGQKPYPGTPLMLVAPFHRNFYFTCTLNDSDTGLLKYGTKLRIDFSADGSGSRVDTLLKLYPQAKQGEYRLELLGRPVLDSSWILNHPLVESLTTKMIVYGNERTLIQKIINRSRDMN